VLAELGDDAPVDVIELVGCGRPGVQRQAYSSPDLVDLWFGETHLVASRGHPRDAAALLLDVAQLAEGSGQDSVPDS
jgi:hypothetical protein